MRPEVQALLQKTHATLAIMASALAWRRLRREKRWTGHASLSPRRSNTYPAQTSDLGATEGLLADSSADGEQWPDGG